MITKADWAERDLAHEADMEALRREQLRGDGDDYEEVDAGDDEEYSVWLANRKRASQGH